MSNVAGAVIATAVGGASSLFSGLPLVLVSALGVSLLAGAGGTLWYANRYHSLEAEVAIAEAKRQEAIVVADARDNTLIRNLSDQLAPIITGLNKQNSNVQIALAKVKSVAACNTTDAARAFDNVVRQPVLIPGGKRPQ